MDKFNFSLRVLALVAFSSVALLACKAVVTPTPEVVQEISPIATPTSKNPLPAPPTPTSTPLPTITPTQDYFRLALKYLTPLPTKTRQARPVQIQHPTIQPTPTIDFLAQVKAHAVSSINEVLPPPLISRQTSLTEQPEVAYIQAATDLMNLSQGNEEKYLDYVATWVSGTDPKSLGAVWVRRVDLDNDHQPEWLVTVPMRRPALKGSIDMPQNIPVAFRATSATEEWLGCISGVICHRLILLFEKRGSLFTPVYFFTSFPDTPWINTPSLLYTEDMNKDGLPEIVLESKWCGASTCGSWFYVGSWDGHAWHDYGQFNQSFSKIEFIDRDHDGLIEIALHGGGTGDASFMNQRSHTIIYGWTGTKYTQVDDIPDQDNRLYFLLIDANTALANQDTESALPLIMRALDQFDTKSCVRTKYDGALVAYTGIEYLLAHFLRGESPEIPSAVLAQEDCGLGTVYFSAIHILLQAYAYTSDPVKACEAMENYILDYPSSEEHDLVPSFYSWEGMQICPLKP